MKDFRSIDSDEASKLVGVVLTNARNDRGAPVAICVFDARGVQLASLCMDGATQANVLTAAAKAQTVLDFQRDTCAFRFNSDGSEKENGWPDHHVVNAMGINPSFSSFAGGVAIRHYAGMCDKVGTIIGAIAVSGRAELDDHKLAKDAITAIFG